MNKTNMNWISIVGIIVIIMVVIITWTQWMVLHGNKSVGGIQDTVINKILTSSY